MPSGHGRLDRARYRRGGLGFPPLQCPEPQQGVGRECGLPVAAATVSTSEMSDAAPAKSPIHGTCHAQLGEVERQLRKRAGVADELDLPAEIACMPS